MKKPDRPEAVALAYCASDSAPRIIAKGRGLIADNIIREARKHGVYVHESPELVSLLMQVDLDQHIPPQLYRAVAELLAWLYKMEIGENILTHSPEGVDASDPALHQYLEAG